jgi:hypothetical protein
MNKKIALLIQKICKESPYSDDFDCEVFKKRTQGFWRVRVWITRRGFAHTEAFARMLPLLGRIYGEAVTVSVYDKFLEVI